MAKIADVRQFETNELMDKLEASREELFKLRIAWNTGSLDNPNQMRIVRKDIARMLTVLRERELAAEVVQTENQGKVKNA
jgi:large subunit ribosomal protein L29